MLYLIEGNISGLVKFIDGAVTCTLDLWNVTCALDPLVSTPIFWPLCQRQMNYLYNDQ